jgi:hypothetical protein
MARFAIQGLLRGSTYVYLILSATFTLAHRTPGETNYYLKVTVTPIKLRLYYTSRLITCNYGLSA